MGYFAPFLPTSLPPSPRAHVVNPRRNGLNWTELSVTPLEQYVAHVFQITAKSH